jgi:hypothetical protein
MKIVELLNKIALPLNNEEADVLQIFDENVEIKRTDLDERQQVIANQLVNKDVLKRSKKDGKTYFKKKIQ